MKLFLSSRTFLVLPQQNIQMYYKFFLKESLFILSVIMNNFQGEQGESM